MVEGFVFFMVAVGEGKKNRKKGPTQARRDPEAP